MRTKHDNPDREGRAPLAPSSTARAVDADALVGAAGPRPAEPLGAGEVLQLQRSAGNAAVARRLGRQRSHISVQRSPASAALLKKLATPKVGEGQATGVQTQLIDELEKFITQKDWRTSFNQEGEPPPQFSIGGVLIDRLPNAGQSYMPSEDRQQREGDIQGLFQQLALGGRNPFAPAVFVNLDKDVTGANFKKEERIGADVISRGLGPKVVENTLKTMLDAGQFEYLRLAGLPNNDWKILVEVHYTRERPKDMAGFHKDTQGQSLFVNLNYHVPGHRLRGPEYVLNPPPSAKHDERIGTPAQKGSMPDEFIKDLTQIRNELGEPTRIESAGTVGGTGYVAFVDEALHHATPWFGGRYVTPLEFEGYLERNYKVTLNAVRQIGPELLAKAEKKKRVTELFERKEKGYSKFADEGDVASFSKAELAKWGRWLEMASVKETEKEKYERVTRYTRREFGETMGADEFDRMLEDVGSHHTTAEDRRKGGAGGWYAASIPGAGLSPIKPDTKRPLKRTASDANLTRNWPGQIPEDVPRRFIRSWVRAVPKSFADGLRK
ncbi:MAG: hypothetical protein ACTHQQ_12050 [Solirubrobacteraceae bacterium]